jgi:deoxyribonuclease IV
MCVGYKVGFHVSIAGGISNSVDNAKSIGCTAFQIFSRNPRGWAAKPLAPDDVAAFKSKLAASGIERNCTMVHMPYLPNLSGPSGEMHKKSIDTLAGEIRRAGELGIPYLIIHLGSHLGQGHEAGVIQLVNAVNLAIDLEGRKGADVMVLLENNAGQKNSIGATFEELRTILDKLQGARVGICFDTCHAFASGYDLRTTRSVEKTLDAFDKTIGLKEMKVLHLNDSKGILGSNLDRHEHIGLGNIGGEGIAAFLTHKRILQIPIIMETPIDEKRNDAKNLRAFCELAS